jgi:hypothetical protein
MANAPAGELGKVWNAFESLKAEARTLSSTYSDAQGAWKPAEGRWSMVECLEHLNTTASAYLPFLEQAVAKCKARGKSGDGSIRHGMLSSWFAATLEPPPKKNFPAPKSFFPDPAKGSLSESVDQFVAHQTSLQELLSSVDGLDCNGVKLRSPASALLRFRLGAAFAITDVHQRRHLWQAEQVAATEGFPAN